MKKTLIVFSLLVMAVFLLSGNCFAKGQVLVYGTTEKVTDMDPCNAYDFHTWEIFYNIYQGLMSYPAGKTNLVPGLADERRELTEVAVRRLQELRVLIRDGTAELSPWLSIAPESARLVGTTLGSWNALKPLLLAFREVPSVTLSGALSPMRTNALDLTRVARAIAILLRYGAIGDEADK